MSNYPTYSDHLVALGHAYDRAALTVRASNWHLADLRDVHELFVEGDDSLSDWTRARIGLLEDQLPAMAAAVNAIIIAESKPWFDIPTPNGPELEMPAVITELLKRTAESEFSYCTPDEATGKVVSALGDNYLILFEGEGYLIPRTIPKSFIEIWWRRYWYAYFPDGYYAMAMVENPADGWDCYGHER